MESIFNQKYLININNIIHSNIYWLHLHHKDIFVHSYKTDPFNEYLSKTSILTKKWLFTHTHIHIYAPVSQTALGYKFDLVVSTWYIINLYTPCVFLS